jgi:hypothetical protein
MKIANRAGYLHRYVLTYLIFFIIIGVSGCTVKLIADYDEFTDQGVTSLHRKVEGFFINMKAHLNDPAWTYENKKEFYTEIRVDLEVIKLRNSIREKNDITNKQLGLLSKSIDDLEELHKVGSFTAKEVVDAAQLGFNSSFKAILALELAKNKGA